MRRGLRRGGYQFHHCAYLNPMPDPRIRPRLQVSTSRLPEPTPLTVYRAVPQVPSKTSQQHAPWSPASPITSVLTQGYLHQDLHPKPASDRALTPSRAHISSPLVTAREQRPYHVPNRNVTYVIRIPLLVPPRTTSFKKQEQTFPHQAQSGRVPARWARAIRSLSPVRGLTPPSIPLPRDMDFFFNSTHGTYFSKINLLNKRRLVVLLVCDTVCHKSVYSTKTDKKTLTKSASISMSTRALCRLLEPPSTCSFTPFEARFRPAAPSAVVSLAVVLADARPVALFVLIFSSWLAPAFYVVVLADAR
jgi:hypothetical protein